MFRLLLTSSAACRQLAILAVLGGCVPGCARWNWRGDGYGKDDASYAAMARPSTGGTKAGFDARAREIEENLGYR